MRTRRERLRVGVKFNGTPEMRLERKIFFLQKCSSLIDIELSASDRAVVIDVVYAASKGCVAAAPERRMRVIES